MPVLSDLLAEKRGLYEKMTTEAWRAVRALALDDADCDDLVGSAWVLALKRQGTIRSPEKVVGWFVRLTRNSALKVVRKRRWEAEQQAKLTYHLRTGGGRRVPGA